MNISFRKLWARVTLACLLMVIGTSGFGTRSGSAGSSSALASVTQRTAPLDAWSTPQDVTGGDPAADAAASVATAPNGAVTIAWERDGDGTFIEQRSNTGLSGAFGAIQELDSGITNGRSIHAGPSSATLDAQGRRHILWWTYNSGGQVCGEYARVDTDGVAHVNDLLTFTCLGSEPRKNTGLAVESDGSVHALFGRTGLNMYYSHMNAGGTWDVQNELITDAGTPKDQTIGVTSDGTVMAAWVSPGVNDKDVFVSTRLGPGSWSAPVNLSGGICGTAHGPGFAADSLGGMRIVWTQACSANGEIYYREWTSDGGGWASNSANVSQNVGDSFQPSITVDSTGIAHIIWSDDTDRNTSQYQTHYARGRLSTGFTAYGPIFAGYFGAAYQKDTSIAANPSGHGASAYIHAVVGSDLSGNKEAYYSTVPGPTHDCITGRYDDVPSTAYYYTATYALAIASPPVMSGYSDCTFRPNDSITRGQTAKIVVNGANRPINATGQHFSDVPSSQVFYLYVETAYNARIISGYSDGTFGVGDNVSRAQFSKMVVLAFNFPTNISGGPHFADVSTSAPLYNYIETLRNRGLISGYNCGGEGEPCIPPDNKPYFRPNDELTRGQAAKIIYQARP